MFLHLVLPKVRQNILLKICLVDQQNPAWFESDFVPFNTGYLPDVFPNPLLHLFSTSVRLQKPFTQ